MATTEDVRERFERLAELGDPAVAEGVYESALDSGLRYRRKSQRKRRVGGLAAAVVVLLGVSAVTVWGITRGGDDGPSVGSETPTGVWPTGAGTWDALPPGPTDGRAGSSMVWTGDELIVWGGEKPDETPHDTGAVYDPSTGSWREVAPGPLSARSQHVAVWTGTEMIICCGRDSEGEAPGAAAYDPTRERWRELAAPPGGAEFASAVWAEDQLFVLGGRGPMAWRYDLANDVWTELSLPAVDEEALVSGQLFWTGTEILYWPRWPLVGGTTPPLLYDAANDEWSLGSITPEVSALEGASAAWTGTELIVFGSTVRNEAAPGNSRGTASAAAYDPSTDAWRMLPDPPIGLFDWVEGTPGSTSAVWTGREVVVWTDGLEFDEILPGAVAFDPNTNEWRSFPDTGSDWPNPPMVWAEGRVVVYGDPVLALDIDTAEAAPAVAPAGETLFSDPSDVVLLFDDGLDGVLAVDPDRRVAGRSVIDGQRAGDQSYRLGRVDDDLVVGWGEIFAAPLDAAGSRLIGEATFWMPAIEPGSMWLVDYQGERIGPEAPTLALVDLSGETLVQGQAPDVGFPGIGIPGGVAFETPTGIALWDAATGEVSRTLGAEGAFVADATEEQLAWCEGVCEELHITDLDGEDLVVRPPGGQGRFQDWSTRFSPDGARLAVYTNSGVAIVDVPTGEIRLVGEVDVDERQSSVSLAFSPDGRQLFFATDSDGQGGTTVGRYRFDDDEAEIQRVPVAGALSFVVLDREDAVRFLPETLGSSTECPAPGVYPSGRSGICGFSF